MAALATLALCALALAAVAGAYQLSRGRDRRAEGDRAGGPPAAPATTDGSRRPAARRPPPPAAPEYPPVRYRDSRAIGLPHAGSLARGTRLPARGAHFATWDPILKRSPNRRWRRFATDELVRMLIGVQRAYAARQPGERPMLIGDLSRPRGGDFGIRYGIVGHSSHQNGLDADIYYPRRDRRPMAPTTVGQVDRRLAQRLVELFVAAGAETVLVGPNVGLTGPRGVVMPYPNHDNHLHVRIREG